MRTTPTTQTRDLIRFEWALAACLFAWFAWTTLPHAWGAINSDFSNYYITAHLVRSHAATSRIYEWIWFQRQKDHLQITQSFSAMPPLTPFSTLFLWPFASLAPLAAKHCWLVLNGGLLLAIAWMLRRSVGLRWSRIALLIAASYPLERNLLNGQYYVLLLFFLTLGLWLHLRGRRFWAGTAVAVAIGLKMFPLLYVLYFLRKRDWKALAGAAVGGVAVAMTSLAAFGWQLHRLYFLQVLPRGMRGESTGPYNLSSASFTVLFHRLFVFEPTLNPHPAIHAAWLFSLLLAVVQLVVVAPLIMLVNPEIKDSRQIQLEWAAVLLACLTLSPLPASYHFVLLFLPLAVLIKTFSDREEWWKLGVLVLLFLAVGFPSWPIQSGAGWLPLLHVPRLYAMVALYVLALLQLKPAVERPRSIIVGNLPWLGTLTCLTALSVLLMLHYQRSVDSEYAGRIDVPNESPLMSQPLPSPGVMSFIAMVHGGYRVLEEGEPPRNARGFDELAHAAFGSHRWTERTSALSDIVSNDGTNVVILDAESPTVSPDGRRFAFQREDHGRGVLWVHSLDGSSPDRAVTGPEFDVLEASFAPDNAIVFAAYQPAGVASLFERSADGSVARLAVGEARYPAVSPDGKWLAYSELRHGSWNLRVRDRSNGVTQVITDAPCNAVDPHWEDDSRSLLYASDCGRAIGQTALYRRQVIP